MKINSVYYSQNFNGLWGHVKKVEPDAGYAAIYEGNYYYPFKDESKELLKNFKYEKVCTREVTGYGVVPYVVETTRERMLKTPLSFTEAEYKLYRKDFKEGKALSECGEMIEEELKQKNLFEYLNKHPLNNTAKNMKTGKLLGFLKKIIK